MRALGLSVVVKGHGMARHGVEQMCDIARFGRCYQFDMEFRNRGKKQVNKVVTQAKWVRTKNLPKMLESLENL